jgi:putative peptide maturation dehydrogenase
MRRFRRATYLYLQAVSGELLDVAALARGHVELARSERTVALSALTGESCTLSDDELQLVLATPDDRWTDLNGLDGDAYRRLAACGVLVTDADDGELAELRRRDERLSADGWHPHAALMHFGGKWRDVAFELDDDFWNARAERYDSFVARNGPPPPSFHVRGGERRELPLVEPSGGLYDALARRRTTRAFDADAPVTADSLALLLYEVFGCHGYARITDDVAILRKTSPSGGARHALEAYPLILNDDGIEPGLYHYDVGDHALELVRRLPREEARSLAVGFAAGQTWLGDAGAAVVVTARFPRTLWKYRRNNRAYLTLYLEAGHFSQTFYLVCADLGLGAFVTAAVNGGNIEDALELDPVEEGVLAVCGCGTPLPGRHALEPEFRPYIPRYTPKDMPLGQ